MIDLRQTADGVILPVHAQPGSRRNGVVGVHAGRLKVAVHQPPEKGRANEAILRVLCEVLSVSRSDVALVSGGTSQHKKCLISGVSVGELERRIAGCLPG